MTTEILTENKVDWSKPQWLICDYLIVLTNGKHKDETFEGLALPNRMWEDGEFSRQWKKSEFKQIPAEGLTIKIKND